MKDREQQFLYEYLGEMIKNFRKRDGVSQDVLAKKLGKSRTTIVNLEKGRHHPPVHLLIELSRIFGISIKDFFEVEQWENSPSDTKLIKKIEKANETESNIEQDKLLDFIRKSS